MATESEQAIDVIQSVKWRKLRSILVIFGGITVLLTLGSIYSYGNLAPYFVSYLRARGSSPNLTYKEASWLFACTAVCQGIFGLIGGILERKIGPRLTVLIGCLFVSGGVALTYFTISHGFLYMLITYGGMFGTGIGIAYYIPVGCAMRWFPTRKGFIAGFVVSGFGGGAFIFNQVSTAVINPHNVPPDLVVDENYFFTQPEVLDNVPTCMLVLSGIYITMGIIGTLFISNPPVDMTLKIADQNLELTVTDDAIEGDVQNLTIPDEKITEKEVIPHDMTTWQMLKTKTFYHLWLMLYLNNHASVFISTLYKAYGQTFIRDDRYLSIVGAFASVCNACGRIMWGTLADQSSFQVAAMGYAACVTCLFSTFLITELGGKGLFFIYTCLIYVGISGNYSTFPSITMRAFGSTNYSANFGLLCTALSVSNITSSVLVQFLYGLIGYHGLFFVAAGLSFFGCVLAFLFPEPEHIS